MRKKCGAEMKMLSLLLLSTMLLSTMLTVICLAFTQDPAFDPRSARMPNVCLGEDCLQKWATDTVNNWSTKYNVRTELGSYDQCLAMLEGSSVEGLSDDYSVELINACAIVLHGVEY